MDRYVVDTGTTSQTQSICAKLQPSEYRKVLRYLYLLRCKRRYHHDPLPFAGIYIIVAAKITARKYTPRTLS